MKRLTTFVAFTVFTLFTCSANPASPSQKSGLAEKNLAAGKAFMEENRKKEGVIELPNGLQYRVINAGSGPKPKATDIVSVRYRGTLIDGSEFDSSARAGKPASFGVNSMIKGWQEAIQIMPQGSKWQIVIPPELGYGEQGAGSRIGPNETMVFDIELVEISGAGSTKELARDKAAAGAESAIDPTELKIEIRCGQMTKWSGLGDTGVYVIAPQKYDLIHREIAYKVASAAHTKALRDCPRPPKATRRSQNGEIRVVGEEGYVGGEIRCLFKGEKLDCPDNLNNVASTRQAKQERVAVEQERVRALEQKQAADEQRRRSELEAQARLDQKTQAFADQHGVNGGWVNWQQLRANPFSYDGKILLFIARFERMISPTSGLFNDMIVTDLPRNAFLEPKVVLLVAKVTGASEIKNVLGGTEQVPQASYVNHVFCQQQNCGDYAGRLR